MKSKKTVFRGVGTALVTPFCSREIDFDSLGSLIEFQIAVGINALIVGGTTGECATLSLDERLRLYEFSAEKIAGKVPLIFGTGTNDTAVSVEITRRAAGIGASAALVVTPYYNKGTSEGIITHYLKIAEASDIPIILYNVPSRCGVNLSLEAVKRLSEHENIVGIKEASDSLDRLTELAALKEQIDLYSGNDSQIYSVLSLGGRGVISVASNAIPEKLLKITKSYFSGRRAASLYMQIKLLPFIKALFAETNPSPIKYAMSLTGMCREEVRLPLTAPSLSCKERIEAELKALSESVIKS